MDQSLGGEKNHGHPDGMDGGLEFGDSRTTLDVVEMLDEEKTRKRREQLNRPSSHRIILNDMEIVGDKPVEKRKKMDSPSSIRVNYNGCDEQSNNGHGPQSSNYLQQFPDSSTDSQFVSKDNLIGNLPKSNPANSLPPGLRVDFSAISVPNQIAHLSPPTQSHLNLGQLNLLAPTPPQGRIIAEIPSQPQPQIPQIGIAPQKNKYPVVFKWPAQNQMIIAVNLIGSWDNWLYKIPLVKSTNDFSTIIDLNPGRYEYKYLVDGKLTHNNVISIDEGYIKFIQNNTWLGIDLGTTNSCVVVWRNGKLHIIPNENEESNLMSTCVSFKQGTPIVGNFGRRQNLLNPNNTILEMKRLFGRNFNESFVKKMKEQWPFKIVDDGHGKPLVELELTGNTKRIRPVDIQAMVLKNIRERAELFVGHSITKAVITVPSNFNSEAKAETMEAARISGFDEGSTLLLYEPMATAYYYGYCAQRNEEYRLLIFDVGGGFLNVGIIEVSNEGLTEKMIGAIAELGGKEFDWKIFELASLKIKQKYGSIRNVQRDKLNVLYLLEECQKIKIRLSTNNVAHLDVSEVFSDLDGEVTIDREEYEEAILPLIDLMIEFVRKLLAETKLEPNEINEVLLVGGSSRLPIIQRILSTEFGRINMSLNADEANAYGAAIFAGKMNSSSYFEQVGGGRKGLLSSAGKKEEEPQQQTIFRPNDSPYLPKNFLRTDLFQRIAKKEFKWNNKEIQKDVALTLADNVWISGDVINGFFQKLNVTFFPTFVDRPIQNNKKNTKYIFHPFHMPNPGHFVLMKADIDEKRICMYDSYITCTALTIKQDALKFFLNKIAPENEHENWKLQIEKTIQQDNAHDCGCFTMIFGKYLAEGKQLNEINQQEMKFWRRFILYTLIGNIEIPGNPTYFNLTTTTTQAKKPPVKMTKSFEESLEEAVNSRKATLRKSVTPIKMQQKQKSTNKDATPTKAATPTNASTSTTKTKAATPTKAASPKTSTSKQQLSRESSVISNSSESSIEMPPKIASKSGPPAAPVETTEDAYDRAIALLEAEGGRSLCKVGLGDIIWNTDNCDVDDPTRLSSKMLTVHLIMNGVDKKYFDEEITNQLPITVMKIGIQEGLNEVEKTKGIDKNELKKHRAKMLERSEYDVDVAINVADGKSLRLNYEKERRKKIRQKKRQEEAKKKSEAKQTGKMEEDIKKRERSTLDEEKEEPIKKTKHNTLLEEEEE